MKNGRHHRIGVRAAARAAKAAKRGIEK